MKRLLLIALCCCLPSVALAEVKGFQLSLTPQVALESPTTQINGVALNIWGENPQSALAVGFVNGSSGQSGGASVAFLGNYAESYKGVQLAWLGNYASGTFTGVQWAMVNYAVKLDGVQLGFVNVADSTEKGVQIGFVNVIKETDKWFSDFPDALAPAMVFLNWRF